MHSVDFFKKKSEFSCVFSIASITLRFKVLFVEKEPNYLKDIAEIRSLMERSSRVQSLSGLAGILAGVYALVGAYTAHSFFNFRPAGAEYVPAGSAMWNVIALGSGVLILAIATAGVLTYRRAVKIAEHLSGGAAWRLLGTVAVPLFSGGIFLLLLISMGLNGLLAPVTMIFYGLALYHAGSYTHREMKTLGLIQIVLGLLGGWRIEDSVLLWSLGFGLMHIVYGIYIHIKHER